ncbi:unnamed protein product [Prorocentrum cordatum]|nr:unnamed protein product [Polarella glacialis]
MMVASIFACAGFAMASANTVVAPVAAQQVAMLGRSAVVGDEGEDSLGDGFGDEVYTDDEKDFINGGLGDFDFEGISEDKKPKKRLAKLKRNFTLATGKLDEIIPELQTDFKYPTQQLKVALAWFKEKQRDLERAKKEATKAMKELRLEAEKRRLSASERRRAKERERRAIEEATRTAKAAMIKKAQALMSAKGQSDESGMLGEASLGIMVDVLMALPAAVENPVFIKRLQRAKDQVTDSVSAFLNITRRKTAKFVLASSKASDVELSFLMARYFHEASFRVKAMQSDAEKVARDLNVVMPRKLRTSFNPILKQLRSNAVPLRVNASQMAEQTLSQACTQMGQLMSNITQYDNQLNTLHTGLHNVWQMSELMLPHMSRIYPMKTIIIDTVKDFMMLATTQIASLQDRGGGRDRVQRRARRHRADAVHVGCRWSPRRGPLRPAGAAGGVGQLGPPLGALSGAGVEPGPDAIPPFLSTCVGA